MSSVPSAFPSVYFVSLGCPKNRVDTEVMLGLSSRAGHRLTEKPDEADVIVVNTCGFIGAAKEESVDTILEMAAYKKSGRCQRLVVTGCLSQRYPTELHHEIPEIDHILGSGEVDKIAEAIHGSVAVIDVGKTPQYLYDHDTPRPASQVSFSRYVKIAEGCDRPCGFCIIPALRGSQRSRSMDSIEQEIATLSRQGTVEINLVAQDLTLYGKDLPSPTEAPASLPNLLRRIGHRTPNAPGALRWVRLHYAYPTAVTDELLKVMAQSELVVPYLDCPLQHIDDKVLKLMRRGHTEKTVLRLLERTRRLLPNVFFRTAFIVGHPGESEEAFTALCQFVEDAELDHVGVFPYSQEEGTPSAELPDQVPPNVAQQRQRELLRIQRRVVQKKRKSLLGRSLEVLVEGPSEESDFLLQGRHKGQAPEIDGHVYLTLGERSPDGPLPKGTLVSAQIVRGADYDLVAQVTGIVEPAPASLRKLRIVS
ncbi:MAG TPA: 30S ribosomal protein S12 methylthiotransferase RimO [Pseudomonadota bacterium]|nr:30S ribosomal protein S12 methylthiotransferase RimO [Pseudomonadota bacterium]